MAQHCGFFNALESEGTYDRKYNADDYSSNMGAIISTGVRRSGDNDLNVTASGLTVTVAPGRAWIEGRWYSNDTALELETVTPPTGTLTRIDGVFLRLDTNLAVRNTELIYKTGTPSGSPTAPACIRDNGIYEIMLAKVRVVPSATSLTITDTRADKAVCGWVTSPVGYDDYFEHLDSAFNEWFTDVKDELASVTLFKQYTWRGTMQTATDTITFSIPQYDPTGVDIIQVYVNGLLEIEGSDYTLSGSVITFTDGKAAGTKVDVVCYKSIDGTGLGDVSDEVAELQDEVDALGSVSQFYYFSSGENDNVKLCNAIDTIFSNATGKSAKINVVGTFSATAAVIGSGTAASPFRWFDINLGTPGTNKIYLDFTNCNSIDIQPPNNSVNVIFDGGDYEVRGIRLNFGSTAQTALEVAGTAGIGDRTFDRCTITITGARSNSELYFTPHGEIINCKITMFNQLGNAAVAECKSGGIIKIFSGTLTAYTGDSESWAAPVCILAGQSLATICAFGTTLGTSYTPAGRYQTDAARIYGGHATMVGCITDMSMIYEASGTLYEFGTVPIS